MQERYLQTTRIPSTCVVGRLTLTYVHHRKLIDGKGRRRRKAQLENMGLMRWIAERQICLPDLPCNSFGHIVK